MGSSIMPSVVGRDDRMPALFWKVAANSLGDAAHVCELLLALDSSVHADLLLVGWLWVLAAAQGCKTAPKIWCYKSDGKPIRPDPDLPPQEIITEHWVGFRKGHTRQFPRIVK